MRISLAVEDASLTVTEQRIGLVWRQQVTPGFQVIASSVKQRPGICRRKSRAQGARIRSRWASRPIVRTALNWHSTFPAASTPLRRSIPFRSPCRRAIGSMCRTRPAKECSCRWRSRTKSRTSINGTAGSRGGALPMASAACRRGLTRSAARRPAQLSMPCRCGSTTTSSSTGVISGRRRNIAMTFCGRIPNGEAGRARPEAGRSREPQGRRLYLSVGQQPGGRSEPCAGNESGRRCAGHCRLLWPARGRPVLFDGIKDKNPGWVAGMYKMPTGNLFQVSRGGAGPRTCSWEKLRPNDFWPAAIPRVGTAFVPNTCCRNGPKKRTAIHSRLRHAALLFRHDRRATRALPASRPSLDDRREPGGAARHHACDARPRACSSALAKATARRGPCPSSTSLKG